MSFTDRLSSSSSSSAWVFAATELIRIKLQVHLRLCQQAWWCLPLRRALGFNFPCCWQCPPGLWYEPCWSPVRGSTGSIGAPSSSSLLPSFPSAPIAAQSPSPPCPCLSPPCSCTRKSFPIATSPPSRNNGTHQNSSLRAHPLTLRRGAALARW